MIAYCYFILFFNFDLSVRVEQQNGAIFFLNKKNFTNNLYFERDYFRDDAKLYFSILVNLRLKAQSLEEFLNKQKVFISFQLFSVKQSFS